MLRDIGAVLLGLVVGSALNMALVLANLLLFPLPEGTSFEDPAQMAAFIASLPAGAFVLPMLAHQAQAFGGGWLAARLGRGNPRVLAGIVAAFTLVGGVINLVQLDPPLWTWIELPVYLLSAWGAGELEVRRRARAS